MGYGKTNLDDLDQQRRWKVPADSNGVFVFFCPPWAENITKPFHEYKVHWNIDSYNPVVCLRSLGGACPICAVNDVLRSNNDERSKEIYAKSYFLYNIIPNVGIKQENGAHIICHNGNGTPKVEIFSVSPTLHKAICASKSFHGDIFDPMNGKIVHLARLANAGQDPKQAKIFPNIYPQNARLDAALLNLVNNLPDLSKDLVPKSVEELQVLIDTKMAAYKNVGVMQSSSPSPMSINPVPNVGPLNSNVPSIPNAPNWQHNNTSTVAASPSPMQSVAFPSPMANQPTVASPGPIVIGGASPVVSDTPNPVTNTPTPPPNNNSQSLDDFEKRIRGGK